MTNRRRWRTNVGFVMAACIGFPLVISVVSVFRDALSGGAVRLDYFPSAVVVGLLVFPYAAIPVFVFLGLGELLWPWVPHPRVVAIVLGALVMSAVIAVAESDQLASFTPYPGLLVFPAVGAAYGALVRLPSQPSPLTTRDTGAS